MSAPTWTDEHDDDLGLPSRPVPRVRPRPAPLDDQLPPLQPAVVDEPAANPPASSRRAGHLEQPSAGNPAAPRPRVTRQPRPPLRADVLALVLAAVVCVCVTVLALKGVDVPEVLQTIGFVAVGGAFGMAIPSAGRRP